MTLFRRPVRRETAVTVRDRSRLRPLVIELGPHAVTLRPKGTRYRVTVSWDCIYSLGTKLKAEETRGVRATKRKRR